MSNEARQSSFELANSKSPPLPRTPLLIASFNLKPFPSSKFFLTLYLGSGDVTLASPGLKNSLLHAFRISKLAISKLIIFKESKFFMFSYYEL